MRPHLSSTFIVANTTVETCGDLPQVSVQGLTSVSLIFGCLFMLWQIQRAHRLAQNVGPDHSDDTSCCSCCVGAEEVESEHGNKACNTKSDIIYATTTSAADAAADAADDAAALEEFRHKALLAAEFDQANRQSCLPELCLPHQMIFPLYYTFMKIAAVILLVRGILFIIGSRTDYFSVANLLFVNPAGACLEEGVSFFLSRNSAGEGAVRQTTVFAVIWFIIQFGLGLSMTVIFGVEAAELVNFVPTESFDIYWMSFDVLKSSFYAIALLHSMCREQSRPHASFYAAFNLCCYGASLVGDLLLVNKSPAAPCTLLTVWLAWDAFWPLAVYYTLLADSNWWSSLLLPNNVFDDGDYDPPALEGDMSSVPLSHTAAGLSGSDPNQHFSINDAGGAAEWTFAADGSAIGVPPRRAAQPARDTSSIVIRTIPAAEPSAISSSARKSRPTPDTLRPGSASGGRTPNSLLNALSVNRAKSPLASSVGSVSRSVPAFPSSASPGTSLPGSSPTGGTPLLSAFGPHGAPIVYPADLVIPYDQLRFGRAIGSGGTATVYRGHWRGQLVAIKSFKCEMLTREYVARFAQEMVFAATLHDQNVVRCMGICVVPPSICIVTEFMERGSLFRVLSVEARALSYRRRLAMAVDACAGVAFLHSCDPPIIHRDIKSLNFLVDREYRVKLADLGEARELSAAIVEGDEHLTKNRGTPHWMAPEVFLGANYNERVDVYSLGVVMWEIITSRRPFEDVSPWLIPAAVVERRQRPALPDWIPASYAELISAAWAQEATARPTAQQLLECLHALLERAPADDSWPSA